MDLEEDDIPGAKLEEPLDKHNKQALRWWLQCHGISPKQSSSKQELVDRIREAKQEGSKVIDVDGSYASRKRQRLQQDGIQVPSLGIPQKPPLGWENVNERNYEALNIPTLSSGTLYNYLAEGVGFLSEEGAFQAFRALSRGYTHWASGRIESIEINLRNPDYCHVRCTMRPSMKSGHYRVYVLLSTASKPDILLATCECAAGQSASCTHVSALLHALVALSPSKFNETELNENDSDRESGTDGETPLPVTSYPCKWKPPSKRKESNLKMFEGKFEKHVYGKPKKRELQPLEAFDPRPEEFQGTATDMLSQFLTKMKGKGLGVSLLFDKTLQYWRNFDDDGPSIPSKQDLLATVKEFKNSLQVSEEKSREIERSTVGQRDSPEWFSVRRYRLTASSFGEIFHRRPQTLPDKLVLRLLNPKKFSSLATDWGIDHESVALNAYLEHQHAHGHEDLTVCHSGFYISHELPFLGCSPDGNVYDPQTFTEPYGFLEIKCPYKFRDTTILDAARDPSFCCEILKTADGEKISLRRNHNYYCQIQGQMAIGKRPWCDFVVWTTADLSIQRVKFDKDFWTEHLLPKLSYFYDFCFAPEVVSPVHILGLPLRDLGKE